MELMYIYIDKYRIFENEKIVFSTKFLIDYDKSRKKLSIKENKDYFNIYPDNIVNFLQYQRQLPIHNKIVSEGMT